MMKLKIAIVVGLLAALATVVFLADAARKDYTTPAAEPVTLQRFITLARTGTAEQVAEALDSGIDINRRDNMERTALTEALLAGKNDTARLLIDAGADVTLKGRQGYTPLINAANTGDPPLVRELLEQGANTNRTNDRGITALHAACRSTATDEELAAIVDTLLEAGANPQAADDQGFTPLMVAASRGRAEVMGKLIDAGADINARNQAGMSAIFYAVMSADFFYRSTWELSEDETGEQALRRLGVLAVALEQADARAAVRLLLGHGADINTRDAAGWTPLMRAAALGDIERYALVIQRAGGDPEAPEVLSKLEELVKESGAEGVVLALRNADAYVNLPNNDGIDALAISRSREDTTGKLIHGLLLEGKRVPLDLPGPQPETQPDPDQ